MLVLCYSSVLSFLDYTNHIGCSSNRDKEAQKMRENRLTIVN